MLLLLYKCGRKYDKQDHQGNAAFKESHELEIIHKKSHIQELSRKSDECLWKAMAV
jgi:hypothetical protein